MDLNRLLAQLGPTQYKQLRQAVETGKWPNGVALNSEQKENCLQLVMLWQSRYNTEPQHVSIAVGGELVLKTRAELQQQLSTTTSEISGTK
ncbi:MAG: hypothetical protein XXXJIFNMEKO3_01547 [Candidatus Erwinia impunctatus]|nr:hypothetical protein XXXJIFNMEKO_01547 [Culicoides impunctatus]